MSSRLLTITAALATALAFVVACSSSTTTASVADSGAPDGGELIADGAGPADAGAADGSLEPLTWTWRGVAGAKCRDGSDTGIGVNLSPGSTKTVIFLEGGGACFTVCLPEAKGASKAA